MVGSTILARLGQWAQRVKRDVVALYLAAGDPDVPWYAKAIAALVAAYALSPIDLIPDVVPVLGYLDDAVIVPLGIVFAVRLIRPEVMARLRAQAETLQGARPTSRVAAATIVTVWTLAAAAAAWWMMDALGL